VFTFKLYRGTAAQWIARNPVLQSGEPAVEIDTGKLKIGDGFTKWNDLGYLSGEGAPGPTGPVGPTGPQGVQGSPGTDGADGAQGSQGIQGLTGAAGSQGIQGATGSTGPQGSAGADGADGSDGLDYSGPSITVSSTPPSSPSVVSGDFSII